MSNFAFGTLSNDRMKDIHPDLQKVARRALRISSRRKDGGVDFTIPSYGGLRTTEDQQKLYSIGRTTELNRRTVTRADGVIKKSNHQAPNGEVVGYALDVLPIIKHKKVKGNAVYSSLISEQKRSLYFHFVAACMLQAASELGIRLSWGGNWASFQDLPHFTLLKEGS